MDRYLDIVEVSQKQAYIFSSNHLKDNVLNSATIAYITSSEYFTEVVKDENLYSESKNMVFSGGGHTVLEFPSIDAARKFNAIVTASIHSRYPRILIFTRIIQYDEKKTPGQNIKDLTTKLEEKKSIRSAYFHQGTFGIEDIDTNTLLPKSAKKEEAEIPESERKIDRAIIPGGYESVSKFGDLGGSEGEANFIAVVHIDGNGMGNRVKRFYENNSDKTWEEFKELASKFSKSIDKDFKAAFAEMNNVVARRLQDKKLEELDLKSNNFPVRRIISSGDDICFVTDGRIGVECAAEFIKALIKKENAADCESYSACAGVVIVHSKFPFFRAYEIAEALCSNAKRYGASLSPKDNGACVSAIDWHIEYGELGDSLGDIRKDYRSMDDGYLNLRPYIVDAPEDVFNKDLNRNYESFRKLMRMLRDDKDAYSGGTLKNMRNVLKQGEKATEYYLKFHNVYGLAMKSYQGIFTPIDYSGIGKGEALEKKIFIETYGGTKHAILFDAIELLDCYLFLGDI